MRETSFKIFHSFDLYDGSSVVERDGNPRLHAIALRTRGSAVESDDTLQETWLRFRRAAFKNRGTLWSVAEKTSRPERALENLLERDRLFTAQPEGIAQAANVRVIYVDCSMTKRTLQNLVTAQFALHRASVLPPSFDF